MKDMNHQLKNPRGSSPPFQEFERWIENGANGSHWVKIASVGSQQRGKRVKGLLNQKSGTLLQSEDEGRWEDDGGVSS